MPSYFCFGALHFSNGQERIPSMVMSSVPTGSSSDLPTWLRVLLGIVFVVAGVIVLGNVTLTTLISVLLLGWVAIIAGIFEIVHSFWTKGWGGFIWQIILGLLYIGAGIVLLYQPVSGVLILTWLLGIFLIASGAIRIFVGFSNWAEAGWMLLISGIFGIIAGFIILAGWPLTGLWVIGLLIGIDLILHGIGWLAFGSQMPAKAPA
jgi:uncharacterized membrane protein HdeD (DUF308 family)